MEMNVILYLIFFFHETNYTYITVEIINKLSITRSAMIVVIGC